MSTTCISCGQRIRPPVARRPERAIEDAILDAVRAVQPSDDFLRCMETLVAHPEHRITQSRELAHELALHPTTLISIFFRLGLPSPKRYLAWVTGLRAAHYLADSSRSCAAVAHDLGFGTCQQFGRTLKTYFGLTVIPFRTTYTPESLLARFVAEMLMPYRAEMRRFRLTPRPRWEAHAERQRASA